VVSGLSAATSNFNAQIVLAGDPNQLGPIIQSELGKELGFGCSYLERLMQLDIYDKNPVTMKYDGTLITKLKKNYRSHPALITLPNRLFYNGDMEACTEIGIIEILRHPKCNILPNKKFPVVFRSVYGQGQRENDSPR
jgi:helicase MOV-10